MIFYTLPSVIPSFPMENLPEKWEKMRSSHCEVSSSHCEDIISTSSQNKGSLRQYKRRKGELPPLEYVPLNRFLAGCDLP